MATIPKPCAVSFQNSLSICANGLAKIFYYPYAKNATVFFVFDNEKSYREAAKQVDDYLVLSKHLIRPPITLYQDEYPFCLNVSAISISNSSSMNRVLELIENIGQRINSKTEGASSRKISIEAISSDRLTSSYEGSF